MKITIEVNPRFLKVFNKSYNKLFKNAFESVFDDSKEGKVFQTFKNTVKKEAIIESILCDHLECDVKDDEGSIFSYREDDIEKKIKIEIGRIVLQKLEKEND